MSSMRTILLTADTYSAPSRKATPTGVRRPLATVRGEAARSAPPAASLTA